MRKKILAKMFAVAAAVSLNACDGADSTLVITSKDAGGDAGPDASADAGRTCAPPDLNLAISPRPLAEAILNLASPGGLSVVDGALRIEGKNRDAKTETYTVTGPFADLPPDTLEGLDRALIEERRGGFLLRLSGCGRMPLEIVSSDWTALSEYLGSPPSFIDLGVVPNDPCLASAADACPRNYALRASDGYTSLSVQPGHTADLSTQRVIVGRVDGCLGDASADAHVEYVKLPRRDLPACRPAPAPPSGDPRTYRLLDTAGHALVVADGQILSFDGEVAVGADSTATGLVLTPVAPTPDFAGVAITLPDLDPATLRPPLNLRFWASGLMDWQDSGFELSDARRLRAAAVSGTLAGFERLRVTALPPTCVTDGWFFRPLRLGDESGRTAEVTGPGVFSFLRPAMTVAFDGYAEFVNNVCTTDIPDSVVSFVVTFP